MCLLGVIEPVFILVGEDVPVGDTQLERARSVQAAQKVSRRYVNWPGARIYE